VAVAAGGFVGCCSERGCLSTNANANGKGATHQGPVLLELQLLRSSHFCSLVCCSLTH